MSRHRLHTRLQSTSCCPGILSKMACRMSASVVAARCRPMHPTRSTSAVRLTPWRKDPSATLHIDMFLATCSAATII
jgi:hypothetical protein